MYEDFLSKVNLTDAPVLAQAMAYDMLVNTLKSNHKMPEEPIYLPDSLKGEETLLNILELADYWSNDLYDIFVKYVTDHNIDTPLAQDGFKWIHKYTKIAS